MKITPFKLVDCVIIYNTKEFSKIIRNFKTNNIIFLNKYMRYFFNMLNLNNKSPLLLTKGIETC